MGLERALVWLAGLLVCGAAALAYLRPVAAPPTDVALVALAAAVTVPLLLVFVPALLARGERGWN